LQLTIHGMTLTQKFNAIPHLKFSFSKSTEFSHSFALDCGAASMYDLGFGLGIPNNFSNENKLRAVFNQTFAHSGVFLFNLSGVDMKKAKVGFVDYDEAEYSNQITEWELFMVINNKDYLKNCIFHNGKVEFKKRIIWNSVKL
jgi:hypothetical protein